MSIVKIFAERGYSSTTFALKEIGRDVKEKLRLWFLSLRQGVRGIGHRNVPFPTFPRCLNVVMLLFSVVRRSRREFPHGRHRQTGAKPCQLEVGEDHHDNDGGPQLMARTRGRVHIIRLVFGSHIA